jgi:hypothetical protein
MAGWWAKSNEIAAAERQAGLQRRADLRRTGFLTAPSYPVEPGAPEVNKSTYVHALPEDLTVDRDALAGIYKIAEG